MSRLAALPVLLAAAALLASCSDEERNPFDASADRTPPELGAFEIVQQSQHVYATWSASEPVRVVVEYDDAAGQERHSYGQDAHEYATSGILKLVGVESGAQYQLTGVRLADRAGNETVAHPGGLASFATGPVADDALLSLTMIDVGWGDALYMETPDGKRILIDAGHPRERDARPPLVPGSTTVHEQPVRWFLEKHGVSYLDFVSMTHVHEDHIGGFYGDDFGQCTDGLLVNYPLDAAQSDSCPSATFAVGTFIDLQDKTPGTINGPYLSLLKALDALQGEGKLQRHVFLRSGESSDTEASLQWGADLRVDLLCEGRKDYLLPDYAVSSEISSVQNNDSMVYRVQYGDFVMILMGDGEFATEQYLENHYSPDFLKTTMLKLGHHGSNDANSERWLKTADPVVAFIPNAVSENPGVEHPFVLNRLRNMGIDYYASDRVIPNRERSLPGVRGDVHLLTDGEAFTVLVDNILYE